MFKNMKLGTKIGVGFGILIIIACALGGLAVKNMKAIEGKSIILANEYAPEVELANSVERNSAKIMFAMRGYTFSEEREYLERANDRMKRLDEQIGNTKKLSEKAEHLVKLRGVVGDIEGNVGEYKKLTAQTEKTIGLMHENRKTLDSAAAAYMKNCEDFLNSQNEKIKKEFAMGVGEAKLLERLEKNIMINDIIDVGNTTRIAAFKSQALRDPKIIQDAVKNFDIMADKLKQIRNNTTQEANLKQLDNIQRAADEYKQGMLDFLKNWQALQDIGAQRNLTGDKVLAASEELAKAAVTGTKGIADDAVKTLSASQTVMIIGLIIAFTLGVAIAFFITRSITRPINRIIEGLNEGSDQVASASGQVSSASQSLAEGASEQAASIEETSSSLEEMSSMTKQNADNANQADNLMKEANQVVTKANDSMRELTTSMAEISKASEETSKIIKTIDEIAFQTNLLALNAAVEAARAGEAGAGFAVVADEVRNLAMRAADAAKNTANLIEGTVKKVKDGGELVATTNEAFTEVANSSAKVGGLVAEIAAASKEQAEGIDQVNKAVAEMDKVVQQNAANAEESASASEEMNAQAEQMKGFVNELVELVGGGGKGNTGGHARVTRKSKSAAHKKFPATAKKSKGKALAVHHAMEVNPNQIIPMDDDDFKDF